MKLHFFSNFRALCNDAKTALFELVSILIPTYFDVSRRINLTNFIFCISTYFCFSDLNVQIQALNQVLDTLDHQIDNLVEEIIRIRIPGR